MKQLFALIALFYTALGHADTTLVFKLFPEKDSNQTYTYQIKDGLVRISEQGSNKISLYDKSKQLYQSFDKASGTISRIDKNILGQSIEHLNQQRLAKLAETEKLLQDKLKSRDDEDRRIAEALINQLKYPDIYGAHTFIKVEKTSGTKTINNIECQIYTIKRREEVLKQVCMASSSTLGMPETDYQSLRDFYHFNYSTQTQVMLAMGKSDFSHIDFEAENMPGIPIEIRLGSKQGNQLESLLHELNTGSLGSDLMQLPNTQN
ncbi:MAG: hypothetical protein OEY89_06240 [Gammaproteobacteria bacterium]|nr:hypothetical protein [Gammaproteobacteria bacterium]